MAIFHSYVSHYQRASSWQWLKTTVDKPHVIPVLALEEMGVGDQLEEDEENIHDEPR